MISSVRLCFRRKGLGLDSSMELGARCCEFESRLPRGVGNYRLKCSRYPSSRHSGPTTTRHTECSYKVASLPQIASNIGVGIGWCAFNCRLLQSGHVPLRGARVLRYQARTMPQGRPFAVFEKRRTGLFKAIIVDFCLFSIAVLENINSVYSGKPDRDRSYVITHVSTKSKRRDKGTNLD